MDVTYKSDKALPNDQLYALFLAVGWAREEQTAEQTKANLTADTMRANFNIGFLSSTFVHSAWDGEKLVGCVRVLSDLHFRSIIYDLAVLPEYQHQGIGRELVRLCRADCPDSEWLVQTDCAQGFYEHIGFRKNGDVFLTIPCRWF